MAKDFIEEKAVDLTKGDRTAVATLRLYPNGWVVHLIEEEGLPDMGDNDSVFKTLELAIAEAKRIWS